MIGRQLDFYVVTVNLDTGFLVPEKKATPDENRLSFHIDSESRQFGCDVPPNLVKKSGIG